MKVKHFRANRKTKREKTEKNKEIQKKHKGLQKKGEIEGKQMERKMEQENGKKIDR